MEGGLDATHVPYRGGGPLTTALMSGEVDMGFAVSIAVKPFVQSGRLRALAVSTLKPSPGMPNVPTMASVIPGFEANVWHGLFAPTGTPSTILNTLNTEMIRALKAPEVIAALESGGAEAIGTSPSEFSKIVRDEIRRYAKLVQESGAKAE